MPRTPRLPPTPPAVAIDITVDGSGFPAYQPVTVTVGTASAINTGANSDGNGDFETTILLPQQAAGPVSVVISVGGKLHTELLTISTGDVVAPSQPTMDAFAGIASLVRVWKYDNATQGWEFYDPDPALASAVNYTECRQWRHRLDFGHRTGDLPGQYALPRLEHPRNSIRQGPGTGIAGPHHWRPRSTTEYETRRNE